MGNVDCNVCPANVENASIIIAENLYIQCAESHFLVTFLI